MANVKKEDNRAEKRAQTFIGEGSMLRKGGSLEKKDLSNLIIIYEVYLILYIAVAMSAEDWETKYREICEKFVEE